MNFKDEFMKGFYDSLESMLDWENARYYKEDVQDLINNLFEIFRYDVAREIEDYLNSKIGD